MAEIINLHNYIIDSKEKRSFTPWKQRFGEDLNFFSRLSDLSDRLLYLLSKPEYEAMEALRELVMAVLGRGPVSKFLFLADREQWEIDNISGFFQEQIYYEIMTRLEWIAEYACRRFSLVALVENYDKKNEVCFRAVPVLSQSDPGFPEYIKLIPELQKKYLKNRFFDAHKSFEQKLKKAGIVK